MTAWFKLDRSAADEWYNGPWRDGHWALYMCGLGPDTATIGSFCHDLSMSDLYWTRLHAWMLETGQIDTAIEPGDCFDNRLAF